MEYCNGKYWKYINFIGGDLEKYWERKGRRIAEQKVIDIII